MDKKTIEAFIAEIKAKKGYKRDEIVDGVKMEKIIYMFDIKDLENIKQKLMGA